jgi:threonine aldolase
LKEYCSLFDSVSLCFSKGMSTPVGSVIIGSSKFIKKARHFKKAFGGAIRNPGILAAACLLSLDQVYPKIEDSHDLAKAIAGRLQEMGYTFTLPVETNMIWLDLDILGIDEKKFVEYCADEGVAVFELGRIVVHHQTSEEAVEKLMKALKRLIDDVKAGKLKNC